MKKRFLKFKIIMTNISRIIMSFLFVNVGYLFQNSVLAVVIRPEDIEPSCYLAGPSSEPELSSYISLEKVFIIAVPIVLVIAVVSFIIIKKKKSKKNKKEEEKKENSEK